MKFLPLIPFGDDNFGVAAVEVIAVKFQRIGIALNDHIVVEKP